MCETRRLGNKIKEYENFIFCYTGESPGKYGVGFIIKKHLKQYLESYIGLSDRVALLHLNLPGQMLTVIQIYAPTEAADEEEIIAFYETMHRAIEIAHKNYILMGDFNAKIGKLQSGEHLIMKRNGYGNRNLRGQRLVDFALENKLAIINTFYKKNPKRRWTWSSPSGKYKNEIDFILTNRPQMFQNIETLSISYPSDHRPLRAKITLTNPIKSRAKYGNRYSTLKTEEEMKEYKNLIKNQLPALHNYPPDCTVQEYYEKIISIIQLSLCNARRIHHNTESIKVLSERTQNLIRRRHELQKRSNKTRSMKNELKALYKLTSKNIKRDYENHRTNTLRKHLQQNGSIKKGYKELRTNKAWIENLKDADNTKHSRKDIINIATDFYKKLYCAKNKTHSETSSTEPYLHVRPIQNIAPIECKEVIETIMKLKPEKSPGTDNITNDAIKTAYNLLSEPLTKLFNMIIKSIETPYQWSDSNIILLYKKGDPNNIGNYRPISLLPTVYKIFSTIINNRIGRSLEMKQPIEQAGFRKGFCTIDHIHTLELIIEKYQEFQKPLYVAYIDYQKAFDTISHNSIWQSLEAQNVEKAYIDVIKNIYGRCTSRVKLETAGPSFPVERGVRQGDPLSPRIFIAILETVLSDLDWTKKGIYIQGKYLSHLRFADDLVLFSESSSQLQGMIEDLCKASRQVGLEINISKTKIMSNHIKKDIMLDGSTLEYVEQYVYLGKQVGFSHNSNELEVQRRIQNTWNKYWSYKELFKSNMPINLKKKVMDSCLIPCLTYACQTWKFTSKIKNKVVTCQRGMERSMLNIRKIQKIRHTDIRSRTKTIDALHHALKLKWKWAGHVARLKDNRWTQKITNWKGPDGKRCRGRPFARWEEDIKKIAGPQWQRIAQNRENWQKLEEAFT